MLDESSFSISRTFFEEQILFAFIPDEFFGNRYSYILDTNIRCLGVIKKKKTREGDVNCDDVRNPVGASGVVERVLVTFVDNRGWTKRMDRGGEKYTTESRINLQSVELINSMNFHPTFANNSFTFRDR